MVMQKVWKWALKLVEIQEMLQEGHQGIVKGKVRESVKEHQGIDLRTLVPLTILKLGNRVEMQEETLVIQGVTLHTLVVTEAFQILNTWDKMKMKKKRMKMRKWHRWKNMPKM
jgi:hypothetical protein